MYLQLYLYLYLDLHVYWGVVVYDYSVFYAPGPLNYPGVPESGLLYRAQARVLSSPHYPPGVFYDYGSVKGLVPVVPKRPPVPGMVRYRVLYPLWVLYKSGLVSSYGYSLHPWWAESVYGDGGRRLGGPWHVSRGLAPDPSAGSLEW